MLADEHREFEKKSCNYFTDMSLSSQITYLNSMFTNNYVLYIAIPSAHFSTRCYGAGVRL